MAPATTLVFALASCALEPSAPEIPRFYPPAEPITAEVCDTIPDAPVRRLSRSEYLATVRDLFPNLELALVIGTDPSDHGFENRADLLQPQPLLIEQYNTAAAEIAAAAMSGDPSAILPCTERDPDCGKRFVETMGRRLFRRPLTTDELATYTSFFDTEREISGFEGAVQLTLEAMLQAPQFLYRLELDGTPAGPNAHELTSYEIATRMSYLLWGSTPDDELLAKAAGDMLSTPADRETEARRMLADPRARDMLVEFHRQWLDLDRLAHEPKDGERYPEYSDELARSIREESDRFVSRVFFEGDATLRTFLSSRETEVDPRLAELYGAPGPSSGWAPAMLDADQRAGFLTRANFLASRAHRLEGSPPLRGVFVLERLLCRPPAGPPADADLSEPAASSEDGRTNRELFEERVADPACAACHAIFNPLGFAFEHYDAIGRYRATDHDQPVDASGRFALGEIELEFDDAIELSLRLADDPEVMRCAADQWYAYATGEAVDAESRCRARTYRELFVETGGDVRELLLRLVTSTQFILRGAP